MPWTLPSILAMHPTFLQTTDYHIVLSSIGTHFPQVVVNLEGDSEIKLHQ